MGALQNLSLVSFVLNNLVSSFSDLHFQSLNFIITSSKITKDLFRLHIGSILGLGEPKAIPWTQATPFKAAADAWCHMDIQKGDIVAWPTNLGWMMGPWLVYASLLNGAAIALYNGSPLGSGFAKFVQVNDLFIFIEMSNISVVCSLWSLYLFWIYIHCACH